MRLLYILSALIYFNQGIGSLVSQPLFYFLKEHLGISIPMIMCLSSIANIPWLIKPLWGYLNDRFVLFGRRRTSYIILSSIISVFALLCLGLSPFISIYVLAGFMLLESLGGAIKDVAIDGLTVETCNKIGESGRGQSVQWGALFVAQILTGIAGGFIAEHYSYKIAYLLIAVFPILIGYFAFKYPEPKIETKKIFLGLESWIKAILSKDFLLSALFLFFLWFSPSFGTPLLNKMREDLHLSKIWIGWLSTIGAIFSLVGALLYFKFSKGINLRKWLFYGTFLNAISTFAYLYLTSVTVVYYAVLFGVSGAFTQLIIMDFCARTCPEGTEATTFALLCSILNFGSFCSNLMGAQLFSWFGYNGLVLISGITTIMCLGFIPYLKMEERKDVIQA
jgi:MFS family permease